MIDQLFSALKRAAWDKQGFSIGGSDFSASDAKKLADEVMHLMGDSVALEYIRERVQHDTDNA